MTQTDTYRGNDRYRSRPQLTPRSEMSVRGRIKWFDKRYGFIVPESGGADVFFHFSLARRYGIRETDLVTDTRVIFAMRDVPGKRPEATAMAMA